jgi:pimeloyl-ACP methyl ester carboxylesterase
VSEPPRDTTPAEDAATPRCELDRIFVLPDGRPIGYREYGAAEGLPVVALHGTPGSRLKYARAEAAAGTMGLRLICPDRWGYGLTTAPARPALARFAEDMERFADGLALPTLSVIGISGGGPFAAALAARLGVRVKALALVSPVGPIAGTPAAWQLDPLHALCFRALPPLPGVIGLAFYAFRRLLAREDGAALRLAMMRAAPADKALLRDQELREALIRMFRAGLAPGVRGPVIDLELFSRPWEFEPHGILAETRLWLGTADRSVPHAAVRTLAGWVPRCELVELAGEGHFWIVRNWLQVLAWLAETSARA